MNPLDYDTVRDGMRSRHLRDQFRLRPEHFIDRVWRSDSHNFSNKSGLAATLRHRMRFLDEMSVDQDPTHSVI